MLTGGTSVFDVTATFDYAGTATGSDYTTSTGTIVIPAGATTGEIIFTATQDTIQEGDETIDWILTSVTNAGTGSATTGSVSIIDDDQVSVSLSVSLAIPFLPLIENG